MGLNFFFTYCEGPFSDSVQAQVKARILGLLVVVSRDWAWFTAAKWADYKPSGAQSRNSTIHTYILANKKYIYIYMEHQEIVKG